MGSLYSEHRTWLHRVPVALKLLLFALLGSLQYAVERSDWLAFRRGSQAV